MEAEHPIPSTDTGECDALDDVSVTVTRVEGEDPDGGVEEDEEADGDAEGG